jgi:hypothetical protein
MKFYNDYLKLFVAFLLIFALGFVCSSSKDDKDKKDDSKKEDVKKEDTKKDDMKKEDSKKDDSKSSGNKLYFCEEYVGGKEVGVSDVFTIPSSGGYLTVMIKLDKPIGVGKCDLRISRKTGSTEKIVDTKPFDVQPDWDYIHFDKVTFYSEGLHKLYLLKPDGTAIASGEVQINYR